MIIIKKHMNIIIIILLLFTLPSCRSDKNSSEFSTSPINAVTQNLKFQRNNDFEGWLLTLTDDWGNSFSENTDLGVISLEIMEVKEETDIQYKRNFLSSEKAKENNWTEENTAIIFASFEIGYDHTKVPDNDGLKEWHYALVRDDDKSPWLIQDWGYGMF